MSRKVLKGPRLLATTPLFPILLASALTLWPTRLHALGVRILMQDAEAIARGNAFVATADNPSALYYNPAGATQLEGHNVQFGVLTYLGIISSFQSPTGARAETKNEITPVPQLYYTYKPKSSPFSYGLGIYAPFGLGLQWPENAPTRDFALEGRLKFITVNPSVAWQVHRTLSLALGPTINYSRITFRQGIGLPAGFGGVPGDEFRFKGDDFGYGYHAGLLFQPHPQWSFGANYRSETSINYQGHSVFTPYQSRMATSLNVNYPKMVSAGVSYRPTPQWNIEADADWTDWKSLDTLNFKGASFFGNPVNVNLDWHSSWVYNLGVTRFLHRGYYVSCGYFFVQNSTANSHFTPYVPDTDLHVGSLGLGYKGEHWRWALAGQVIGGPKRNVSGSQPNAFGETADGHYQLFTPTVSFSVGYHF